MKKILLGVLALIVLAAPALVGVMVEERYHGLMVRLSTLGIKVVHTDYQRGWFGSTANSELQIDLPNIDRQLTAAETFSLQSTITHGPLAMQGFALAEILTRLPQLSGAGAGDRERSIRTLIHLDGSGRSEIDWPEIERIAADGSSRMQLGEVSGSLVFSERADEIDMRLEVPGGSIMQGDRPLMDMGRLSFESQTRPSASGVVLGEGKFHLERLTLRDRESSQSVAMRGIEVSGESRENEAFIEAEASYRLAAIELAGTRYGPGLLRIQVGRLAAPVLARMQQELESISRQSLSEMEMGMAMLGLLSQTAAGLLSGDPVLSISPLRIETPEGPVEAEFSLQTQDLALPDLANVPMLLTRLQGDFSVRVPEVLLKALLVEQTQKRIELQLAESNGHQGAPPASVLRDGQMREAVEAQVEQQIALWLRQGFVEREGGSLKSVASLSSGLLSVNGKTIPLSIGQ